MTFIHALGSFEVLGSSQTVWEVAPANMDLEFLPDDEILITSERQIDPGDGSPTKALYQLSIASSIQSLIAWDLKEITSQGRYIFKSQPQGLSGVQSSSAADPPAQAFCPPSSVRRLDTHLIVATNGIASVLTSDTQKSNIKTLPKLSATSTDLLAAHETVQTALADQQIRDNPEYQNMSEAGKAALIDTIARSGIDGRVSPDGQYLLLLTSIDTGTTKYSLYLIKLNKDEYIPLSATSDWPPGFLFSPDGSQMIFESNREADRAWYLGASDGSGTIQRLSLSDPKILCWE